MVKVRVDSEMLRTSLSGHRCSDVNSVLPFFEPNDAPSACHCKLRCALGSVTS